MTDSLQSERLTLRRLTADDAPHFARLLGRDSDSVQMMGTMPDPCTEAGARLWIERRVRTDSRLFAILRSSDGEFMGAIGFGGETSIPALGYWIGRQYWGSGYATEAALLVIGLAREIGVRQMEAETFPNNPASARVLEKIGFEFAGKIRQDLPLRGGWREIDRYVMNLLKEWRKLPSLRR